MKKKLIMFLFVLGVVNLVTANDKAADEKIINAYYSQLKSTIKSDKPLVLEKLITRNDRIAGRISVEICNLFETTTSMSEKCKALYVLGVIKHPASIRTLVKNVDFYNMPKGEIIVRSSIPLISMRPAQQALVAIGPRCINDLTTFFLTTKSAMKRYFCLQTIFQIFRILPKDEALVVVRSLVQKRIEKSSSNNKQQLLEELKNFTPGKHL